MERCTTLKRAHRKAGVFHRYSPISICIMPWTCGLRRPSGRAAEGQCTCVGMRTTVCHEGALEDGVLHAAVLH